MLYLKFSYIDYNDIIKIHCNGVEKHLKTNNNIVNKYAFLYLSQTFKIYICILLIHFLFVFIADKYNVKKNLKQTHLIFKTTARLF